MEKQQLTLPELYQLLNENKGLTLNADLTPYSGSGYAVSLPNKDTQIIEADCDLSVFGHYLAIYSEFIKDNQKLGLWIDNGIIYFDISEIVPSVSEAINKGLNRNQIAVFDFDNAESIYIN